MADIEENKIEAASDSASAGNFIKSEIIKDIAPDGRFAGMEVITRFPPEPNGCLHIGHVKALCIDFGMAEQFGGRCNLRMDDTNPTKEKQEFIHSIENDIHWLGFEWSNYCFASAYFDETYEYAVELIKKGLAYVCELSPEQVHEMRGDYNTPATSPYRDRPIEESLDLFSRMKNGEFPDGAMTLRAKIDLASGNWNMRDPVIYRIKHETHHQTGDKWCIYPMYDLAHPIGDALEGVTHSLCSLEYEDHRPLYNWVVDNVSVPSKPRQIEFARLNIDYTVLSKRKLRRLIEDKVVSGWDDPRMPTLAALRRRGYSPAAIRSFCDQIGVAKNSSTVQWGFLEYCLRNELNENATRAMAVLNPIKLIITNYPEGLTEQFEVENNPQKPESGTRTIDFGREIYIEADDFMEVPEKKYFRMFPGNYVRLKGTYIVKCTGCKKDEFGNVTEVYAEYDESTRGGNPSEGMKVKGTIHWVNCGTAIDAEVRLFERLFDIPDPDSANVDFMEHINPNSLTVLKNCKLEPSLANARPGDGFQFLRLGYFCVDSEDSSPEHLVFNRSVELKDSYSKK
ncbi:MAG: glutamine--tRNA ligase/YqeY domain fusion protein [Oscillospiraceae bacterium]|jgi:glutaminyl-tRNA synthetase|nr:glutamine--tRNA ligase/YqeY domain fusion protein [Oscillospiraceae bacterium]